MDTNIVLKKNPKHGHTFKCLLSPSRGTVSCLVKAVGNGATATSHTVTLPFVAVDCENV